MSRFAQTVVKAMRELYPEKLADSSFDNTGLLLEAPSRPGLNNTALLTIDLTKAVADEAIARKDSIIITYHPIIFRALKSLTLNNPQQNTLLRLAQEGISVYSPHTAVDAAPGGLNDFLADIVASDSTEVQTLGETQNRSTRTVITPVRDCPPGFEGAGYGRIIRFKAPLKLGALVARITEGLGSLSGLSVAVPQTIPAGEKSKIEISSIGICAGSGGSMLNGLEVDLLFTGELSHHEALAAIEQGKCVITAFHSNSERVFLDKRMRSALMIEVYNGNGDGNEMFNEMEGAFQTTARHPSAPYEIAVSKVDRDPFEIVTRNQTSW